MTSQLLNMEHSIFAAATHEIILNDNGDPIDYIFLTANGAFEKHTGLKIDEIIGKRVTVVIPGIEKSPFIKTYGKVVLTGEPISFEQFSKELNRYYLISAFPVDTDKFATVFMDITSQKMAEHTIIETNEHLRQQSALANAMMKNAENSNRIKSQFLTNISHEIRTPLNGIIGMNGLLNETDLNEEQHQYCETISNSSDQLLHLLNDILDISKLESKALKISPSSFNIYNLIEDLVHETNTLYGFKNINYSFSIDENVPSMIIGDKFRIRQILNNLLDNAIKFTENGKVSINVTVSDMQQASNIKNNLTLKFEVKDTGVGISGADRSKLFSKFIQLDGSSTRCHEGIGLGLAICKELVSLMNGKIGVSSILGKGSTFWFDLNITISDEQDNISKKNSEIQTIKNKFAASNRHILLVEDNLVNQEVTRAILKKMGLKVSIARHGLEAISLLCQNSYDLVLMDVQMPKMDGFTATRMIRNISTPVINHDIVIVAMTAGATQHDKDQCFSVGMNAYATKPISPYKLAWLLEKWIPVGKNKNVEEKGSVQLPINNIGANEIIKEDKLVFNVPGMMDRLMNDYDLAKIIIANFMLDIPKQIDLLDQYINKNNIESVKQQAHSIKGAAAVVGADLLIDILEKIEQSCNDNKHENLETELMQIKGHYHQLKQEIEQSIFF